MPLALLAALSLHNQVVEIGALAGFAAIPGLAVLSLLYFGQAREVKRLREWAGRAPERAAELEQRVTADAQRRAQTPPRPVQQPATPAAAAANGATAAQPAVEQPAAVGAAAAGAAPPVAAAAAAAQGAGAPPAESAEAKTAEPEGEAAQAPAEGETKPVEDDAKPAEEESGPAGDADAQPAAANGAPPAGSPVPVPSPETSAPAPTGSLRPVAPRPAVAAGATAAARAVASGGGGGATPPPPRRVEPLRSRSASATLPPPRTMPSRTGVPRGPIIAIAAAVLVIAAGIVIATQIVGNHSTSSNSPNTLTGSGSGLAKQPAKHANRTGAAVPPRSKTTVAVLNGTTVTGLARSVATRLENGGYGIGAVTDAPNQTAQTTTVGYVAGHVAEARALASYIGAHRVAPVAPNDLTTAGASADVVVTVGLDFNR